MTPGRTNRPRSRSSTSSDGRRRARPVAGQTLLLAALLVGSAWPTGARAQTDDKARAEARLGEARRLLENQEHEGALVALREAHALYPSPKLHFNFGMVYQRLGREAQALESFERYLAEVNPPTMHRNAEAAIAELKPRMGKLLIRCDSPGAEILIDGEPRGHVPAAPAGWKPGSGLLDRTLYASPGKREILVRQAGSPRDHRQVVPLAAGETRPIEAHLAPPARPATPAPPTPPLRMDALANPYAAGSSAAPAQLAERSGRRGGKPGPDAAARADRAVVLRQAAWASGATAVAALAFGAVRNVEAIDRARKFSAYRGEGGGGRRICGEDDPARGGPGCADLYDRARTSQNLSYGGYVFGSVFAVGSAILFVLAHDALGASSPDLALRCAPLPGQRGLACATRF